MAACVVSCLLRTPALRAGDCTSTAGFSDCFDANSLWLPAGRASFVSLPDTQVTGVGALSLGVASELFRGPVLLHADSPDAGGRDVRVVDYAVDSSFLFAVGIVQNLELSLVAPVRIYQTGAGAGGITSQSADAVQRSALRDPRLGLACSLNDVLNVPGFGLRLALDASLPLGSKAAFAGEKSAVVMPNSTVSLQLARIALRLSAGARLRSPVDFGGTTLASQGFFALGAGVDILDPGLLFVSAEAFGLPPLLSNRATSANSTVNSETLFPAEWLLAARSSFSRGSAWSLTLAGGSGLPLSSETRQPATGASTSHFFGLTTPQFRALFVLRFTPLAAK